MIVWEPYFRSDLVYRFQGMANHFLLVHTIVYCLTKRLQSLLNSAWKTATSAGSACLIETKKFKLESALLIEIKQIKLTWLLFFYFMSVNSFILSCWDVDLDMTWTTMFSLFLQACLDQLYEPLRSSCADAS